MLLSCFYHVRGSAIMPSLLSFAGPLGWWRYIINSSVCLSMHAFFFFSWWVSSDPQGDWGADIIFVFVFLHRLLGTHSKYSDSVRSLSASVCLFVCLTFPTLRHSTVLKGADQEKRDWRGRSLFQKQKKKKRTLVAVYCTAIITMAIFRCRHEYNYCRDNDAIKPGLRR